MLVDVMRGYRIQAGSLLSSTRFEIEKQYTQKSLCRFSIRKIRSLNGTVE